MTLDATLDHRDGRWVLTMTREFAHPPATVWPWLTDPARLARWSPVVPDAPLDAVGARRVRENPGDEPLPGDVIAVDAPHELIHRWGDDVLRWRLTDTAAGCRLTLEHSMTERDPGPMNAAGWHLCLDVLSPNVNGTDTPRVVGADSMAHGWESLRDNYAEALSP